MRRGPPVSTALRIALKAAHVRFCERLTPSVDVRVHSGVAMHLFFSSSKLTADALRIACVVAASTYAK